MKNDVNKEILIQAVNEMEKLVGSNGISYEFLQMMGWRLEDAIQEGNTDLLYGDAILFDKDYPGDLDVIQDTVVESWIERYGVKELARKYITTDIAEEETYKAVVAKKRAKNNSWKEHAEEMLLPYVEEESVRKDIAAMVASGIRNKLPGANGLILPPISYEEMTEIYKVSGLDTFIKEEIAKECQNE